MGRRLLDLELHAGRFGRGCNDLERCSKRIRINVALCSEHQVNSAKSHATILGRNAQGSVDDVAGSGQIVH